MDITLVNLFGVSVIAFAVPFALGFFPRLRIPSIVLELIAGVIVGPAVLGWIEPGPVVRIMAAIGVAFLLFLAGMELDLDILKGPPLVLGAVTFVLSLLIAAGLTGLLGARGVILSPLLVSIALSATSVGIVVPVLRDTGQLHSPTGLFTIGGASVAEFGTIALLGIFFAGEGASATREALLLAAVAVLAVLLLAVLVRVSQWSRGRTIFDKLDNTSAQVRVRFAAMILLGAAALAAAFGFEAILGTFIAGMVFGMVIKGDRYEESLRTKLEAIGFGFFVPVFFVTSGLRLDVSGMFQPEELARIALFFLILLAVRGLPALVYKRHLSWKETGAAGLLQATNLSFIVVAVSVGMELGKMRQINGSALIVAGLLSAVAFPALAQALLGGASQATVEQDGVRPDFAEERM
jgi:Kef-type K+ transport system membrane component KefB